MATPHPDPVPQPPPAPRRRRWLWRCAAVLLLVVAIKVAVGLVPGENADEREVPVAPADLTALRAEAGLRPCRTPGGAGPAALRGVRAACLGDGTDVDVGVVLGGRPALVNVWASWCEVCREELPVLDAYAASPGAVPVLGVLVLSEPADALELLANLGVRFPSVVDSEQAVMRALRAPVYLPVSYVVTGDGTVRQVLPPTPFKSVDEVTRTVAAMTSGAG